MWEDDGSASVVIETPEGSRNKLTLEPRLETFKLSNVLPVGDEIQAFFTDYLRIKGHE
jgi:hypothetical protein